ncbi:hypothetical protein ACIBHY_29875 [Nonomuraea sp. NPDC050547]|uniref:hypothetical protein n=1 Tax=Nonomuraea sp. NPDC050547 TaxID=3364368 RepID=UPI0037A307CE
MLMTIDDDWERWLTTGEGTPPGWDSFPWEHDLGQDRDFDALACQVLQAPIGSGKTHAIIEALASLAAVHDQAKAIAEFKVVLPPGRSALLGSWLGATKVPPLDHVLDIVALCDRDFLREARTYITFPLEPAADKPSCRIAKAVEKLSFYHEKHELSELLTRWHEAKVLVGRVASGKTEPLLQQVMQDAQYRTFARVMDAVFTLAAKVLPYQALFLISRGLRATASIPTPIAHDAAEYRRFGERAARFAHYSSTR